LGVEAELRPERGGPKKPEARSGELREESSRSGSSLLGNMGDLRAR
jgi:hypothetical protein